VLVSEKKFSHFLIKGEKTKTKQNKKIPSSNAIQFQLVLQHPVLVLLLSHQRKRKTKQNKKRVWRESCECLSEAAIHLPPTVSHLLLEALFMQISVMSFTLT
jgi:hypothetical protein